MATAQQYRDLHLLHVHRDTLRCALTRCIACCYKIVLHGRTGLLPNVRPEMCHRQAEKSDEDQETPSTEAKEPIIGLYDAAKVKKILTVGDGNFSYSLAIARALGPGSGVELVATSHESSKSVLETYPDGQKILDELNALPHVKVVHEVDATDAEQMAKLGHFDRVIWNFPCVRAPRGEDGQNQEMELNKQLLHKFFAHVAQILTPTGEVHMTHKTKAPFGQWGIEKIAAENKLRHHRSVVFDRCMYPGYSNKKVLSKGSFPIWDSLTFIFVPEDRAESATPAEGEEAKEGAKADDSSDMVTPVTMDLLKKFYLLLTPSLDDKLGCKKKKKKNGWSGQIKVDETKGDEKKTTDKKSNNNKNNANSSEANANNSHKRKPQAYVSSKAGKQPSRKKGRR